HTLTVRPKKPFKITGNPKPRVGIAMELPEDDRLVVASVPREPGHPESPAARANIPAGAVILAVNKEPVATWADLTAAFRKNAGHTVTMQYRKGLDYRESKLDVPEDLASKLDLPADPFIQEIDGQTKVEIAGAEGQSRTYFLPDWRAVRELLKKNVGKTV